MEDKNIDDPFDINDFNSDLNSKKKEEEEEKRKKNLKIKYLVIAGLSILIIILILVIIILTNNSTSSKEKGKKKRIIGEINCIYEIDSKENQTSILGSDFVKSSDFSIIVDGTKIDIYTKEYIFTNYGDIK